MTLKNFKVVTIFILSLLFTSMIFIAGCTEKQKPENKFSYIYSSDNKAVVLRSNQIKSLEKQGIDGFLVNIGKVVKKEEGFGVKPALKMLQIPENSFRWTIQYTFDKNILYRLGAINKESLVDALVESINEDKNFFDKADLSFSEIQLDVPCPEGGLSALTKIMQKLKKEIDKTKNLSLVFYPEWTGSETIPELEKTVSAFHVAGKNKGFIGNLNKETFRLLKNVSEKKISSGLSKTDLLFQLPISAYLTSYNSEGEPTAHLREFSLDRFISSVPMEIVKHRIYSSGEEVLEFKFNDDFSYEGREFSQNIRGTLRRVTLNGFQKQVERLKSAELDNLRGVVIENLPPENIKATTRSLLGKKNLSLELSIEKTNTTDNRLGFKVSLSNSDNGESKISTDGYIVLKPEQEIVSVEQGDFDGYEKGKHNLQLFERYIAPGEDIESGIVSVKNPGGGKINLNYEYTFPRYLENKLTSKGTKTLK